MFKNRLIIILLGIWLIATCLTFENFHIVWDLVVGAGLIFFGLTQKSFQRIVIWIIAFGISLQMVPLIFPSSAASYLNETMVGAVLLAIAAFYRPKNGESEIPPGWNYNPSSWIQRLPIALLVFLCWMMARYLAAFQLGYIDSVWDPFFSPGTKAVLESKISKAFPVSDAGLGALAYTIELFFICYGGTNRWRTDPWLVFIFGFLVIPVGIVSTILMILQPLVVGTWCTFCLLIAFCMLLAIPFAIGEVIASIQFLRRKKESLIQEKVESIPADKSILFYLRSFRGVTFPWKICLCALLGIALMAFSSMQKDFFSDMDLILGAGIVIVSMSSFAECARKVRWINVLFAVIVFGIAWISISDYWIEAAIGALIGILVFNKE